MRFAWKLFLGGVLSLLLGFAMASYTLFSTLDLGPSVDIGVDVTYAYFSVPQFDGSIIGLANRTDSSFVYYFIVLNVTNRSDKLAMMDVFEVAAGPDISVANTAEVTGSALSGESQSGRGVSVSITNGIVVNARDLRRGYPAGYSQFWDANMSRLIGFTGMSNIPNMAYAALTKGFLYLYGRAEGQFYGGGSVSSGWGLKRIQLQSFGTEFLYNVLVSENQLLRIDSNTVDVFVVTRR